MQRPTIKTIAQETGLSIATVSKALKHSPQVRPETRAIVVAAAERVGYELNMHGVQLRTGKTYQVAAIMTAPGPKQKEWEGAQKKKEKAAERRQAQIERQLINTGAQVIKRGILSTLFGK